MQDVIFKGTKAHFKPYGMLRSVEGKSNKTGIRFKENRVYWNGLLLPVRFRKNDLFIEESLALHTIKYCRLVKNDSWEGYLLCTTRDGWHSSCKENQ